MWPRRSVEASTRGKIFISYRRADSRWFAGRVRDRLAAHFGADAVYLDVDMPSGVDYLAHLHQELGQSVIVVAVIGPRWVSARDPATGERRLEDPNDLVRREIEDAVSSGMPLVPLLIDGAEMPLETALPARLAPLARAQAKRVSDENFETDMIGLLGDLERIGGPLGLSAAGPSAPPQAAGEEFEAWRFVEGRAQADELRDHLARYPNGPTERFARTLLADLEWERLKTSWDLEALRGYAEAFSGERHATAATDRIDAVERERRKAAAADFQREKKIRETQERRERGRVPFAIAAFILFCLFVAVIVAVEFPAKLFFGAPLLIAMLVCGNSARPFDRANHDPEEAYYREQARLNRLP